MKKRMIKLTGALLLVASLFFSGCGKSTQLDDYATNEGSDSVEEGTEAVADKGRCHSSIRSGRGKWLYIYP